jgi:uncharacterized Ntn-hydrolase superfamily protein
MTYSIVARDPSNGQLGVAVQSHALGVGGLCPWAEPGVGAVATQAFVDPAYGPRALDRLRAGESPEAALSSLVAADERSTLRQVAVLAADGRVSAHTGNHCIPEAAHVVGDGFSAQANMMLNRGVPEAMAEAFRATEGSLGLRLLAALDAAEANGGDIRGKQSAALVVVGADTGVGLSGYVTNVRVDDHSDPLGELRRLFELRRALEQGDTDRAAELSNGNPEAWFWHGLQLGQSGDVEGARAAMAQAYRVSENWRELFRRLEPPLAPADSEVRKALLEA